MRCHVDPSASASVAALVGRNLLHVKNPHGTECNAPLDMDRTPDLKGSVA